MNTAAVGEEECESVLDGTWCAGDTEGTGQKWRKEKSIASTVTSASSVFLVGVLAVFGRVVYSKTCNRRPAVRANSEYDRMAPADNGDRQAEMAIYSPSGNVFLLGEHFDA